MSNLMPVYTYKQTDHRQTEYNMFLLIVYILYSGCIDAFEYCFLPENTIIEEHEDLKYAKRVTFGQAKISAPSIENL